MSKPRFNEYVVGGYWVSRDGDYTAVIKVSAEGWYGGSTHTDDTSVPLHGPYRLKRTAKRKALEQLDRGKSSR